MMELSDAASQSDTSFHSDEIPAPNFEDADWQDSGPVLPSNPTSTTPVANRNEPLPPSSGPFQSSPITGNAQQRAAGRKRKAQKMRSQTLQKKRTKKAQEDEFTKQDYLEQILQFMDEHDLSLWDFLTYVFNPEYGQGRVRHHQFFNTHGRITQILEWWISAKNRSRRARNEIDEWAQRYIKKKIAQEARAVTNSRRLQTMRQNLDAGFVNSFTFTSIYSLLKDKLAPVSIHILESLTTSRNAHLHGERRKERTRIVITIVVLACLGEYSHANNMAKRIIALYLYASGAQRQVISVLSSMGICESYTNLVTRNKRRKRKGEESVVSEQSGTLHQLSDSMRIDARKIAATGLFSVVYDNININVRSAEQIIGRHDSQENGTCATLIPLHDAKIEDLSLDDFQSRFLEARSLRLDDILHSQNESKVFHDNLIYTIIRIIVNYGGPGFKIFQADLEKNQPFTDDKIPVTPETQTELHPLPSWNIDESSIVGNAEVDEAIVKELGLDSLPEANERVRFLAGDQLSIARLRALEIIRGGQESGHSGFFWGAWIPGLFHTKIADAHGTLLTHFGRPNTGSQNPGSLWFHNTRLDRLPITTTSLPNFRTCRDLIFVSLYARVLHCLLLVSHSQTLDGYLVKFGKWEQLVKHASEIYDKYASSQIVEELRESRDSSQRQNPDDPNPAAGDMVFENASLFLRDALLSREFNDAIKCGDSGRVILVLKIWALSFRGNGRTKYAYEMLHLIHNLANVWSEQIRNIIKCNWLVNTTGLPNRFVELDLIQEHLNFWIKVAYKARGSNTSWDWLEIISPCINLLRRLAKNFNDILGSDQGTRHAPPDLTKDILVLMDSLHENGVYRIQPGRCLDEEDEVKDVINVGLQHLSEGTKNPLREFNDAFQSLQKRRRMKPVSTLAEEYLQDTDTNRPESPPRPAQTTELPASSSPLPPNTPDIITRSVSIVDSEGEMSDGNTGIGEMEGPSELEAILDDLVHGNVEPTLLRSTEDDVSLDMDEVEIEEDVESEESEWETDVDEEIGEGSGLEAA